MLFNVTLVNNQQDNEFAVEMFGDESGQPLGWIDFECLSSRCTSFGDKVLLTNMQNSQETFLVRLTVAAKAGSFPIRFVAVNSTWSTEEKGSLFIFSEALPEIFGVAILVLIFSAAIIYYFSSNKTRTLAVEQRR